MACFKLTIMMTLLMSVIFLLFKTGFGSKQTGACRPFCTGSDCITVNQHRVDFKTAEQACRDRNGELMTLQPGTSEHLLNSLNQELFGSFWIGLRLPAGACSNLSAPLRGYEWISGTTHRSFIPSFSNWKNSIRVCAPHCVSLSNDQKWTERLCLDKTDGYLCRTKHKDACQAQQLSDPNFFKSPPDCSSGPCQQQCTNVRGGYICSCFKGYISDSKDRTQCIRHCDQQKCPIECNGPVDDTCDSCPDGFLRSDEKFCEDIDECMMDQCDQGCKNTFGGFVCSCEEGFTLKDQVKCIIAEGSEGLAITTPAVAPAASNQTVTSSSAAAVGFVWVWILVAVAVAVVIFMVRFYIGKHQRRREQNSIHQSNTTA